jgi:hypothetical protein
VITVSIDNEFLADALGKILPNGWNVRLEGEGLSQKTVSAISEDLTREKCFSDNIFSTMLSMFSLLSFVPQLDTINIKSVSVDNKVSLFII